MPVSVHTEQEIGQMSRARSVADYIPVGGAIGQTLTKASATDYDIEWSYVGPDITPVSDRGKALVIGSADTPEWGAPVNNAAQIIDAGTF